MDADYFIAQAVIIGANSIVIFKRILASKRFPEQTYNACLGLLALSKKYGNQRLEAACTRALPAPVITYGFIKNILENNQDKIAGQTSVTAYIPTHENIRGEIAYN